MFFFYFLITFVSAALANDRDLVAGVGSSLARVAAAAQGPSSAAGTTAMPSARR
jgi:hypothetical protein